MFFSRVKLRGMNKPYVSTEFVEKEDPNDCVDRGQSGAESDNNDSKNTTARTL